jgi:pectate lyase
MNAKLTIPLAIRIFIASALQPGINYSGKVIAFAMLTVTAHGQGTAFPGAEGFGSYASGGRGGKVYIVTNTSDSGAGSFRHAAEAKEPRIIVFQVSGTIHLSKPLAIRGNATIAGQTAPGDGICIADHPVKVAGDNVILRYLRFRLGDRYQNKGMVHGSGHDDVLSATRASNLIIDHCSFSWSTDEVLSVYGGDSVTLQWNMISEPLNYSYHFETGDNDFENHGYGGIWGGRHLSAHHNLFAHCVSRTPRFNGVRLGSEQELVDFRNNVIYNWGHNNVYGGEGGHYNVVGNYYKPGPSTSKKVRTRIVNPSRNEQVGFGKYFVANNCVDGENSIGKNNLLGVHIGGSNDVFDADTIVVKNAFDFVALRTDPADKAYQLVLDQSGASLIRDTLDQRIVNDVKQGTGRIIDVQGGFSHSTPYEQTVQAWPLLQAKSAPKDADADGMPDEWEKANGLNANSSADAQAYTISKTYTNIEVYINGLVTAKHKSPK